MTRQESIDRLHDEKSRIVKRLRDAKNATELSRMLDDLAHKMYEIHMLETFFCDATEVKS